MNGLGQPGDRVRDSPDVLTRHARAPDLALRYGDHPDQVADVHLPPRVSAERMQAGAETIFAIFLHGGFWRSAYGREHTAPLAEALAAAGFVVCAPEYRRTGQPGGGWPGTFDDVAAAVDRLPGLVAQATGGVVDVGRIVIGGHSAGGHLAIWVASRHRLPVGSRWRTARPARTSVVALAGVSDLTACFDQRLGRQAAGELIGGSPEQFPSRYAETDPAQLLPIGVPVRLVHGTADDLVPADMSLSYAARAQTAGDDVICTILPGAGHFDLIDPLSAVWPQVAGAFRLAAGVADLDHSTCDWGGEVRS
jgi:acetyl esterase/lipase